MSRDACLRRGDSPRMHLEDVPLDVLPSGMRDAIREYRMRRDAAVASKPKLWSIT